MKSRISFMLSASIIGLFLAGCQKPTTASDVQGTWVPNQASQMLLRGTNKCQIVLNADGSMVASVPDYFLKAPDQSSGLMMSGSGQWAIEQGRVKLRFTNVDGERKNWGGEPLVIQRHGSNFDLFFYIGEEGGKRFVFERAPRQGAQ